MLLNRTHSVSRPEELRPSTQQPIQQQQQYQPYHQTMQPFYGLSTMGYYPVIGGTQRSNGKRHFRSVEPMPKVPMTMRSFKPCCQPTHFHRHFRAPSLYLLLSMI